MRRTSLSFGFANMAFLALFPGFALYHLGVMSGGVPDFMGGEFGFVCCIIVAFILAKGLVTRKIIYYSDPYLFTFIFFISYCFFVTLGAFINPNMYTGAAAMQSMAVIIQWVSLFYIGYAIKIDGNKSFAKLLCLLLLVSFTALFLHYFVTGSVVFDPRIVYDSDAVLSHEGFGRSAAITIFVLLAAIHRPLLMAVVWLCGVAVLLMLGGRAEFFGFIMVSPMFVMASGFSGKRKIVFVAMLALAAICAFPFMWGMLLDSRNVQIFDLSDSSSWQARSELLIFAINQIVENPFWGKFGGNFLYMGGSGSYAHNALSAWVTYGVIGFFLYGVLLVRPAVWGISRSSRTKSSPKSLLCTWLSIYCVLLAIFGKAVFWPVPGLVWGMFVAVRHEKKSEIDRSGEDKSLHSGAYSPVG